MNPSEQFLLPGLQHLWGPRASAGTQCHTWEVSGQISPAPMTAGGMGLGLPHRLQKIYEPPLILLPGSVFISPVNLGTR